MTKKERTLVFNLCVIVFNVALGLFIEFALIFALLYLLPHIPNFSQSVPTQTVLPFLLLAGLFAAMIISVRCVTWAIKTFRLEDKLDEKAVRRYIRDESDKLRHL